MKITLVGDIMIEPPVLKAAKKSDGSYDFYGVFEHAQSLFDEADFLVGNLEPRWQARKPPTRRSTMCSMHRTPMPMR